jgi:hypothetical protein
VEHFIEKHEKTSELPPHFHKENTKNQVESSQRTMSKELVGKKPFLQYTKHQSLLKRELPITSEKLSTLPTLHFQNNS